MFLIKATRSTLSCSANPLGTLTAKWLNNPCEIRTTYDLLANQSRFINTRTQPPKCEHVSSSIWMNLWTLWGAVEALDECFDSGWRFRGSGGTSAQAHPLPQRSQVSFYGVHIIIHTATLLFLSVTQDTHWCLNLQHMQIFAHKNTIAQPVSTSLLSQHIAL